MTQLALGETLYIAFYLYDATGAETIDTDEGNFSWPLQRDGSAVSSPSIAITNPSGNLHILAYTPSATGLHTFGELAHVTSGYLTNVLGGDFLVRTHSVDTIAPSITVPVADQEALQAAPGDTLNIYRNADFSVTFALTEADGVTARDLTGSTFRFSIGDRTDASDTSFHSELSISPDSPATAGLVTIAITDTETAVSAFDTRIDAEVWYQLEETDSGALKHIRAQGRLIIHRDIPEP